MKFVNRKSLTYVKRRLLLETVALDRHKKTNAAVKENDYYFMSY